ncbi:MULTISPECIES: efflux RND transporter permease subunit [unclassified Pseudomonas]|nr:MULTISPECIES: efflux RND transporter permease subunit [unclassified Pseudomonas]MCF5233497.1 AcrB/AcrD/AcrF family protein [Pseudomonas sp. PA-5-4H]MCF5238469.1 AcrB/AcrD/AcrF family protein [Pseudomonas sp. PA-5-4G]MCF5249687.1 AcrB/AcrD/AcrF family protein [Pseudomonas sp. PA-5-4B]MCF5256502.1 AcrB/AcrD/AcrF family protein [Pseudomonas sp. PA-5-4B]MCF5262523.1 AcrB/AcrD/AcrF family protein [Pseudomonas sp. PA-5-4A]
MLNLVRIALLRPYTFLVLAIFILIVGPLAAWRTPTDIFPEIRIPVIAVIWQYTGLPPDQMAGRITSPFERVLTTTVNDIRHIEAQSMNGYGIVKIFFQPGVNISTANAQVTSVSQAILRQLPPSTVPPLVLNYSASTVPIVQLALSGPGLSEQRLGDIGLNQVRLMLTSVPGAALPYPFGGKSRQVQIDLDSARMQARGLSAQDVATALATQNLITPVGTQKIGSYEFNLQLNNSPSDFHDLENLPIKTADGTTVLIRDVATVRDGNPPQTNIVHVNGNRSVLLPVLKTGSASTLGVIAGIKEKLADNKAALPPNLNIDLIGDQSLFVRSAISGVAREGLIAAALTSLMILLFLGSWRSTVIIATSIPLAILASIATLSALGETLNIMTLGGLALAVGILVDDATVTIENINWHLEQGKPVQTAILDGAAQIVTPAFVSLLCICIVFVPMFFLEGVARFLFVPMAEAVIFAMIASFLLSRTLVPTLANYLLKPHLHGDDGHAPSRNPLVNFQRGFEKRFEAFRERYHSVLHSALHHRRAVVIGLLAFVAVSFALVPFLGRNFFPEVDSGLILLHVRAPVGTRVESNAHLIADIENAIRRKVPAQELKALVDNIGLSISGINVVYNNTGTVGSQDADIQISLNEGHRPTAEYMRQLRETLPREFPSAVFSFPASDIVGQILNFGSSAPIDLQITGNNLAGNFTYASALLRDIRRVPGVVDARIQQSRQLPTFNIDVDRTRAQLVGLTERDVTNSLVVNLAGSSQVAPTFWLNPANGISYPIVMQTPQYNLESLAALHNLPLSGSNGAATDQTLGGLANIQRSHSSSVFSQSDIQPVVEVLTAIQDRDLGGVAADIQKIIAAHAGEVPTGSKVILQGQVQTMNAAFSGLLFGLLGAVVLIYLLIVVNFQSWADPFVIITALPAALAGIVWMLFVTHTPLSVPALTGAIMCMGVATANAILVVSFCRERLAVHGDAVQAALEAGFTRLRPVLMTAISMIIGMAPMALGLGEGGEQNAPLGRAVIGGLAFATIATLILVPLIFSLVHGRRQHATLATTVSQGV